MESEQTKPMSLQSSKNTDKAQQKKQPRLYGVADEGLETM
jgi:hypothetical protein